MVQARLSARHRHAGLVRSRGGNPGRNDAFQPGIDPTLTLAPETELALALADLGEGFSFLAVVLPDRCMTLALEHLPSSASPLSRWDPRWKLAGLVLAALAAAVLQTVPAALLALVGA